MENEGELKKRIMKLVNTSTSSVTPDVPEEIFPIFDELKKEWRDAFNSDTLDDWEEKWFGLDE